MSARARLLRALAALALWLAPAALAAQTPAREPGLVAAWSQIGSADSLLVRAATTAPNCPRLAVDGVAQAMAVRARPSPDFPVTVCEASIARSTTAATLDEVAVPTLRRFPERIVVIGETGCPLRDGARTCSDAEARSLARIAARAASLRPDLVIHTGNYLARERACPPGDAGCAGSPAGDSWDSWTADVFAPAAPLFAAAPWLALRGANEACGRASEGWFRLLDPHPRARGCLRFTEPYIASFGALQIAALDTAEADERAPPPPALVEEFTRQFDGLVAANFVSAWLVSHRPIWAGGEAPDGPRAVNPSLRAAARNLPDGIGMILAGHRDGVRAFSFGDRRPATVIVGSGGAPADRPLRPLAVGDVVDGLPVRAQLAVGAAAGFVLIEREGEAWRITVHGADGTPLGRCRLQRRTLDCAG